jgi:uncharacterized protein (DUF1330 family)
LWRATAPGYVCIVLPERTKEPDVPAYGFAHLRDRRPHPDILEYLRRIQGTLDPFHGRFLVHGPPTAVVEGSWPGSMVLIEFPGMAEARAWYESPEYQKILRLRADHIDGDLVLVEGVGPGYDPRERAEKLQAETTGEHA